MSDPNDLAVLKRSVLIAGHRTSVSIEEPFWTGLRDLARRRGLSLNGLVAAIDAERRGQNLSSAIPRRGPDLLSDRAQGADG
jgi:predicted DNA-binding ribbon-helix-helix protein